MKSPVKRFILIVLWLYSMASLNAQPHITLYHMPHVPQAQQLNPAQPSYAKGYLMVPLLSGGSFGASNSAFALRDIGLRGLNFNFGDRQPLQLLAQQTGANELLQSYLSLDWLSAGFQLGKGYWSFGITERMALQSRYNADFVTLFADAEEGQLVEERRYNLGNFALNALHWRSYSIGYAYQVNKKLRLGTRLKYLWGYEAAQTQNRDLTIRATGNPDFYELEGQLRFHTAGFTNLSHEGTDIVAYFSNPQNQGFAFDLGVHFRVNDRLELAASVTDIGGINWENNTNSQTISQAIIDPFEQADSIFTNLTEAIISQPENFRTQLPTRAYLSAQYFFRPQTSVGLLLHPHWWADYFGMAASVSLNTRFRKWLGLSVNYTYLPENATNIGTGFSLNLGALQLYGISDNVLSFLGDERAMHLQGGINYTFHRTLRTTWEEEPLAVEDLYNIPTPEVLPDPSSIAVEAPTSPYYTLQGDVRSREDGAPLDQFNMDVFEILPDGQEELIRTGRYPQAIFQLSLKRGVAYRLRLERWRHETTTFDIPVDYEKRNDPLLLFLAKEKEEATTKLIHDQEEEEEPYLIIGTPLPPADTPTALQEVLPAPELPSNIFTPKGEVEEEPSFFAITQRTSLRAKATHQSKVLQRLAVGTEVELLEKTRASWWKIRIAQREGWVKAKLLEKIDHRS